MTPEDHPLRGTAAGMSRGFEDPVAHSQRVFRAVMDAMSRPGSIHDVDAGIDPPPGLSPASAALGLALLDHETSAWLPGLCAAASAWLRFHTGCALAAVPEEADYVLVPLGCTCPDLSALRLGSDEEPHRSATAIIDVAHLEAGSGWRLAGPGIRGEARLGFAGLAAVAIAQRNAATACFPRGIDAILACGARIAALPRTTRMET
jgi:alpha-D-ribose 1-methylphosphonate 5-triphosphate synthase subunit PhnH